MCPGFCSVQLPQAMETSERPTHLSPPWPELLLGLFRRGNSLLPHPPFATLAGRTGPWVWLCALVCAPGLLWVSVSSSVRVRLYQLTTLCPFNSKVAPSRIGAAAAVGDRPEDSGGGSSSEERSSGLASDPELPVGQGQSRDPLEVSSCQGEGSLLRGLRLPRDTSRAAPWAGVWLHDEGKVFQGVISALSGTHETSPSSRQLAAKKS